jgi:hypothetical protein
MRAYRRSFRSCPLSIALVLPPLAVWFIWPALDGGWRSVWQLGPLMVLFTYAILVCFANRVRIEVTPRGVWMRKGPLPVGPQTPPVLREHIAEVYVRRVVQRIKGSNVEYLAAGVRRVDGACLDLSEESTPDDAVLEEALAIAAALDWSRPIAQVGGPVQNLEAPFQLAYLGWAGVLMFSLIWVGIAGALELGGR